MVMLDPHVGCKVIFFSICMYVEGEEIIRVWHPNERWREIEDCFWTWGEVRREWARATRNLFQYRDKTHIEMWEIHDPCGLQKRIRSLIIDRSQGEG